MSNDPFQSFLSELADGSRWQLIRTRNWEEFTERLSEMITSFPRGVARPS